MLNRTDGEPTEDAGWGLTKPYIDEFLLRDLYETQEFSVAEITEILECSETTIRNYMRWFGIECRNGVDRDPSPAWFGTRPDGYECWNDGHQTVYVHRLVAVAEWGFEAVASGVIHHKNQSSGTIALRDFTRSRAIVLTSGITHGRAHMKISKPLTR